MSLGILVWSKPSVDFPLQNFDFLDFQSKSDFFSKGYLAKKKSEFFKIIFISLIDSER